MSTRNQTPSEPGKAETFAPAGAEGGAVPIHPGAYLGTSMGEGTEGWLEAGNSGRD